MTENAEPVEVSTTLEYAEGFHAEANCYAVTNNPYKIGTIERERWKAGYQASQMGDETPWVKLPAGYRPKPPAYTLNAAAPTVPAAPRGDAGKSLSSPDFSEHRSVTAPPKVGMGAAPSHYRGRAPASPESKAPRPKKPSKSGITRDRQKYKGLTQVQRAAARKIDALNAWRKKNNKPLLTWYVDAAGVVRRRESVPEKPAPGPMRVVDVTIADGERADNPAEAAVLERARGLPPVMGKVSLIISIKLREDAEVTIAGIPLDVTLQETETILSTLRGYVGNRKGIFDASVD